MLKPLITGSLDIRQLYGSQYTIHISVNRPIFERLQIIHHGTNNSNHAQILWHYQGTESFKKRENLNKIYQ
jgi:hypothetical protein